MSTGSWSACTRELEALGSPFDLERALVHLNEFPDYYTRLEKTVEQAKLGWSRERRDTNGC
jgi:hypothetical protein